MNASTGESITSLALFANLRRSFDVLLLSRSGNLYDWKFVLAIFTELIILLNHWCTKWERTVFFNDPFWKGHMVTIELWPSSDHLEGGQVVMVNEVSYCLRHDVSRWAGAGKHLEIFTDFWKLKMFILPTLRWDSFLLVAAYEIRGRLMAKVARDRGRVTLLREAPSTPIRVLGLFSAFSISISLLACCTARIGWTRNVGNLWIIISLIKQTVNASSSEQVS